MSIVVATLFRYRNNFLISPEDSNMLARLCVVITTWLAFQVNGNPFRQNNSKGLSSIQNLMNGKIPLFPMPFARTNTRPQICSRIPLPEMISSAEDAPTWLRRREFWIRTYTQSWKSCCQLSISLPALQSCVNGYRGDALNNFCTQELGVDHAGGLRAHPCCYSLSSQRYTCFEKYPGDLLKVRGYRKTHPAVTEERKHAGDTPSKVSNHSRTIRGGQQNPGVAIVARIHQNQTEDKTANVTKVPCRPIVTQQYFGGICRKLKHDSGTFLKRIRRLESTSGRKIPRNGRRLRSIERGMRICCTLAPSLRPRCFKRKLPLMRCTSRSKFNASRSKTSGSQGAAAATSKAQEGGKMRRVKLKVVTDVDIVRPWSESATVTPATRHNNISSDVTVTTPKTNKITTSQKPPTLPEKLAMSDECCHVGATVRRLFTKLSCHKNVRFVQEHMRNRKSLAKVCRANYFLCCRA